MANPGAADLISQLPTSQAQKPSPEEAALAASLFESKDPKTQGLISSHLKAPLIAGAVAGIVMLPVFDDLIRKYFPSAQDNVYYMIIVKVIIAIALFYILSNWSLARS